MRILPLLLLFGVFAASSCGGSSDPGPDSASSAIETSANLRAACIAYGDTVELSGVLRRETHPGRPNFESVDRGDEAETGFYLHLIRRTCTRPVDPDDASEVATDSVSRVQLILDSADYARLQPLLDQSLTVRGTLFSAFTGHHHAPLLLRPIW
jgi:hypothetical protein